MAPGRRESLFERYAANVFRIRIFSATFRYCEPRALLRAQVRAFWLVNCPLENNSGEIPSRSRIACSKPKPDWVHEARTHERHSCCYLLATVSGVRPEIITAACHPYCRVGEILALASAKKRPVTKMSC